MRNIGYYNGTIGPLETMTVPMGDRALYFGDGVYDVATMLEGKFFALDHHIDRFFRCCEALEMPMPMDKDAFRRILRELRGLLDEDVEYATFYFQASRGVAPRNHLFPGPEVRPSLMITVKAGHAPDWSRTARLISLPDLRYRLCHIKTLNLLPNVLACQQAREAGADEAVLHKDGRVTECSHSGLAILKNGVVITAPLNEEILPSVTRRHLTEICAAQGIPLEERFYTLEELGDADEALVLSTSRLFTPVTALDGAPLGGKDPALLDRLRALYRDYIRDHLTET